MTRINADLRPRVLTDQHLMAEYRELPMVMASLRRSLRTRSVADIISGIPSEFTLNRGHVTFFYDKLLFLEERYGRLVAELQSRKFSLDPGRQLDFTGIPPEFFNDWKQTTEAAETVRERIEGKLLMKPGWYRFRGCPII